MYFRLCDRLYLVSAVRLDWVSTHDTISLTRNMFMHSHALHIVFLLYYALSLVVFSILILSLSLSFSLLVMAPKKSVPSKNSIRHGSSSSSFAPCNFVRFCDEKAWDDLFENFSDWAIHLEHQVILSNFPDTSLPDAFSFWGWATLCKKLSRFLTCSYRSFTPTCMPSIPLYLGLLRYSEVHVS